MWYVEWSACVRASTKPGSAAAQPSGQRHHTARSVRKVGSGGRLFRGECYYPMGVFQGDVYPDGYCWEISIDLAWKPELELGGKGPKIGQPHPERNKLYL